MPKVRDLGIQVLPETFRPPEIGPGGGGDCTNPLVSCDLASDCGSCTMCTQQTNCGSCTMCTQQTNCGNCTNHTACGSCTHITPVCSGGCSIALTVCHAPSVCAPTINTCGHCSILRTCVCTNVGSLCTFASQTVTIQITTFTPCGGSIIGPTGPFAGGGGLTRESVDALRKQLQQQLDALEQQAKSMGPQTAAEIDAREAELKAELADLAARRKALRK